MCVYYVLFIHSSPQECEQLPKKCTKKKNNNSNLKKRKSEDLDSIPDKKLIIESIFGGNFLSTNVEWENCSYMNESELLSSNATTDVKSEYILHNSNETKIDTPFLSSCSHIYSPNLNNNTSQNNKTEERLEEGSIINENISNNDITYECTTNEVISYNELCGSSTSIDDGDNSSETKSNEDKESIELTESERVIHELYDFIMKIWIEHELYLITRKFDVRHYFCLMLNNLDSDRYYWSIASDYKSNYLKGIYKYLEKQENSQLLIDQCQNVYEMMDTLEMSKIFIALINLSAYKEFKRKKYYFKQILKVKENYLYNLTYGDDSSKCLLYRCKRLKLHLSFYREFDRSECIITVLKFLFFIINENIPTVYKECRNYLSVLQKEYKELWETYRCFLEFPKDTSNPKDVMENYELIKNKGMKLQQTATNLIKIIKNMMNYIRSLITEKLPTKQSFISFIFLVFGSMVVLSSVVKGDKSYDPFLGMDPFIKILKICENIVGKHTLLNTNKIEQISTHETLKEDENVLYIFMLYLHLNIHQIFIRDIITQITNILDIMETHFQKTFSIKKMIPLDLLQTSTNISTSINYGSSLFTTIEKNEGYVLELLNISARKQVINKRVNYLVASLERTILDGKMNIENENKFENLFSEIIDEIRALIAFVNAL